MEVDVAVHPSDGIVNTYAAPGASGDPATIVPPSPLTDTDPPICARASTSKGPVNLVVVDVATHPADGMVNTYTEPGESPRAPTAIVPPSWLADTDAPNSSSAAPSDAVSLTPADDVAHGRRIDPLLGLLNKYAAPASSPPESLLWAPTMIALPSPLDDTELPKPSPAAPSDAVSLTVPAVVDHPPAGRVNT